jgi:hypothetical protein
MIANEVFEEFNIQNHSHTSIQPNVSIIISGHEKVTAMCVPSYQKLGISTSTIEL